jgi:hypothetical protein
LCRHRERTWSMRSCVARAVSSAATCCAALMSASRRSASTCVSERERER